MEGDRIDVGSMVSHRDKQVYVELRWGMQHGQLPLSDARQLAMQILEAAEAAETDAMLLRFVLERLKQDVNRAGQMVVAFREFREERMSD